MAKEFGLHAGIYKAKDNTNKNKKTKQNPTFAHRGVQTRGKIGKRMWSVCWLPGIPDRVIQSGDRPCGQVGNASNPESPRIINIHPQILASQ